MDVESDFHTPAERYACTGRGWTKLLTWFFALCTWSILVAKANYADLSRREFTAFIFILLWLTSMFIYLTRACALNFILDKEVKLELYYCYAFAFLGFIAAICISTSTCEENTSTGAIPNCFGHFEASAVFAWFSFLMILWDFHLAMRLKNGSFWWQ